MTPTKSCFYRELDVSKRQIRLVRLLGQQRDGVELKISVFSLDDDPEYTALSYCWGSDPATMPIGVNGETFYIRPNLYAYLVLLNKGGSSTSSWLFIDAICINQSDLAERSRQVGLMGDVYRNAHCVEVWLGASGPMSEGDRQLWSLFADVRQLGPQAASMSARDYATLATRCVYAFEWFDSLCKLEYWTRLWIVQEMALARALVFRYKTHYIERGTLLDFVALGDVGVQLFMDFEASAGEASSLTIKPPTPPSPFVSAMYRPVGSESSIELVSMLLNLAATQNQQARNRGLSLYRAVSAFSAQDCTVLHDKIYGLLGMTASKLKVDYCVPLHELYLRTLIEGLLEYESLQDTGQDPEQEWPRHDFEQLLANALGLDPLHPTVFLLTEEAYRRVGLPRYTGSLELFYSPSLRGHSLARGAFLRSPILRPAVTFLDNTPFWIRRGMVRFQLRLSTIFDSFLQIPGQPGKYAAYSHCVNMVDVLYNDVYDTMFPGSRAEIDRLRRHLDNMESVSDSEAKLIVHQISCLPTPREVATLFGHLCERAQTRLEILSSNTDLSGNLSDMWMFICLVSEAQEVLFSRKGVKTMMGSEERSKIQHNNCCAMIVKLLDKLEAQPSLKERIGHDASILQL